jgi:hypothetical protein
MTVRPTDVLELCFLGVMCTTSEQMSASGSVTLFWFYAKYFLCADHNWTNHEATSRLFVKPFTAKLIFASPFLSMWIQFLKRCFPLCMLKLTTKDVDNVRMIKLVSCWSKYMPSFTQNAQTRTQCGVMWGYPLVSLHTSSYEKLLYEIILNSIYWLNITAYCSALVLHILEASVSYLGPVTHCPALA